MDDSIVSFFEQWIEEFTRAVEMFAGEKPVVAQKPAGKAAIEEWEKNLGGYFWWEQELEGDDKFKAWVGSEEACWSTLGGAPGDEGKELFQEMMGQANQGAVAVLSATFKKPLRFANGTANAPEQLQPLRVVEVTITFRDAALPSIIVALEAAAGRILDGVETEVPPESAPASQSQVAISNKAHSAMLARLMDLHFPVSVLLGQTIMPIRDVLKLTSGSLIELDRQIGEYVEIVVHGTVVARGEIVAIKGNYGVRIKEVISRQDRIALQDAA